MLTSYMIDRLESLVIAAQDTASLDAISELRRIAALPAKLRSDAIDIRAEAMTWRNSRTVPWTAIDAYRDRADILDRIALMLEGQ